VEHISSRQNPLLKHVRELARGRGATDEVPEVLLEGPHLLEEAWRSNVELALVLVASDAVAGRFADHASRAAAHGARVVTVPPSIMDAVSPVGAPSGILAVGRPRRTAMPDVLREKPPLLLALEGVQDPGNVGAIIRAAEACGATGVVVGPGCADPFGWKAVRGSMGSLFRVPVITARDWVTVLKTLRDAEVRLVATVPRGGTALTRASLDGPTAILLGGEGPGLSDEALGAADERLSIEMREPVESLNVAISAALILYEASRQRSHVALR
jgi:TrmH family RNA methyltransferase